MKKFTRKYRDEFVARFATAVQTLDLGCGASPYAKLFPNRTTFDIDPDANPDVVGDVHRMPFPDGAFEMVLCTEMLEHVHSPKEAIREMFRVLKPGGRIVLTTRFVFPLHEVPHDYWRFTKYSLHQLFDDWENVEIVPETRSFSTLSVLMQRMVFQSKFRFDKPVKAFLLGVAWLLDKLNPLIYQEYGGIRRDSVETDIMPSGYFVSAQKPLQTAEITRQ